MSSLSPEALERIRAQFDYGPYPRVPLEATPKENYGALAIHDIRSAFYRRDRKLKATEGACILDVGCGSGFKTLMLALANPRATIVGVDLSAKSVELAQERLKFQGFPEVQFYALGLDEIGQLGLAFDYINCDELLYFFDDPAAALGQMKAVLKPDGIIRTNLHSKNQRLTIYRLQELFKFLGFFDSNPEAAEMEAVTELMNALQPRVLSRAGVWKVPLQLQKEEKQDQLEQWLLANLLLQADKGYGIPDLRQYLETSGLEFLGMVQAPLWRLSELFGDRDQIPAFWALGMQEASLLDQAYLYDLLHPVNRLFDFWCSPQPLQSAVDWEEWPLEQRLGLTVQLHPQLVQPGIEKQLQEKLKLRERFSLARALHGEFLGMLTYEPLFGTLIRPLFERSLSVKELVQKFQQLQPLDYATGEPWEFENASELVWNFLEELERDQCLFLTQA
ncbi:class I SAM-dependent methyltransferase [Synechococcus elongatus]|uniref:Class I SAM-dependent methyltransferase n=1 Tax=Synechococcus elongatus PCC 11802 TaxID=2283154 RepID=A0AAT9JWV8_SYNEL|nr:class I SAM-dependent methyltransferase [Synechococcus elongatus]QFZ91004.1 class I SAM-dependent methyltransferase [Synechococcus elongatus PCC 11802]